MNQENNFHYTYSAPEKQEVLSIRDRYLPKAETKLDELKRLDKQVQTAGTIPSLCVGILSCLVFGVGLCLCLQVIGNSILLGVALGILGIAGMLLAYPVKQKLLRKAKQKYVPRILELTAQLTADINA